MQWVAGVETVGSALHHSHPSSSFLRRGGDAGQGRLDLVERHLHPRILGDPGVDDLAVGADDER